MKITNRIVPRILMLGMIATTAFASDDNMLAQFVGTFDFLSPA